MKLPLPLDVELYHTSPALLPLLLSGEPNCLQLRDGKKAMKRRRQVNFWLGRGGSDPTANTGYCPIFQELGKVGKKKSTERKVCTSIVTVVMDHK